jgi:hypothetical protein
MTHRLLTAMLAVVLAAPVLLVASGGNPSTLRDDLIGALGGAMAAHASDTSGSVTFSWILVGGGMRNLGKDATKFGSLAIGTQLHALKDSPEAITPDLNPTTEASGSIFVGPFPKECNDKYHYHGALFGVHDTGKNCGWGKAIPFDEATDAATALSAAVMFELRAQNAAFDVSSPDPAMAVTLLGDAAGELTKLGDAIDLLQTGGKISARLRTALRKQVDAVAKLDTAAASALEGVSIGDKKTQKILKRALAKKSKMMQKLAKANAVASPDGAFLD